MGAVHGAERLRGVCHPLPAGEARRPDLPRLRVYISDQTHSSVEKAAITLGIGQENVVKIPSDETYRMQPESLEAAVYAPRSPQCLPPSPER